ncbi:carboxymuconolactone decarboxylase family protein [Methanobrevibacter cuticularis]|uniref:Carboxymuconolactone decarboxylase family protein n=1 Tax=Methanobrevibacter cuticularis TaxID=47311 RepID=A0A166D5U1_9EURY|nr:carboxymuconolactone decarboxylase family protein [Methanobrevibacter cuticularis]KZX15235.1 carboxymuconolactone decarboxylase family protein [Methanobrevibacter cuticularis]
MNHNLKEVKKGDGNMEDKPKLYKNIRDRFEEYGDVLAELGKISSEEGPIDKKTSHLIKLSAAAAIRSEGAVHSHAKRALAAGASEDEIYHSLILITSTIGFPTVAAAISWVDDIVYSKKG